MWNYLHSRINVWDDGSIGVIGAIHKFQQKKNISRVDRLVTKHLSAQGRLDPRGGLPLPPPK
jgi:hypothetical protein